jgi:hypothetical protein
VTYMTTRCGFVRLILRPRLDSVRDSTQAKTLGLRTSISSPAQSATATLGQVLGRPLSSAPVTVLGLHTARPDRPDRPSGGPG